MPNFSAISLPFLLSPEITSKSDFEVISGTSKKGKEIAEKLGITARPGYPVTEAGKADLRVVKPPKDRPSIRLIKNFERDMTDIELAQEGYTLQEIDILMRARRVMKEEGQNPDDALAWVRGEMADDAGVDIEEFMPDFDWGDFPGKYSTGGGVGSLFRERQPMFVGGLPLTWGKGLINYISKKIAERAAKKKFMADLDKKLFDEKGNLKEGAVEKHFQEMTADFNRQLDQRKQFIEATPPKDRKPNAQGGGVGSMFRRVGWLTDFLAKNLEINYFKLKSSI